MKVPAYQRKTQDQRRVELIEAGIRCLGEGGMSGFTIDKICRQANVSRGLINHHFKSKDALLLSIYDNMTQYLVSRPKGITPQRELVKAIEDSFDARSFKKSNMRAWLAIWGEVATSPSLKALHEKRYAQYKKRLAGCLQTVSRSSGVEVDANATARQLIALIDGLWLEYCLHSRGFSLKAAQRDCLAFLSSQLGVSTLAHEP